MTNLRIFGAVALSSFIAAAALAANPRDATSPHARLPASCQMASAGSTAECAALTQPHPIHVRQMK